VLIDNGIWVTCAISLCQILECAVLGVPDDILGERVLAVIALRTTSPSSGVISCNSSSNAAATASSAPVGGDLLHLRGDSKEVLKALRAFLHDKLAQYKQPREYVLVDAIPRNHLGKVRPLISFWRFHLRQAHW
jgi:acyl-CoA synthetase (AMP-forming)/AMP-acid ligase II